MKRILIVTAILMVMCGCSKQKYTTEYLDLFDTYSTLTIYTNDKDKFDAVSKNLHANLMELNKKFNIYNNYENINNIKTINDNAGIKAVKVDKETLELIKAGKEAYNKTQGTVNIALGSVLKIWHNYRTNALDNGVYEIPTVAELEKAKAHTDINSVVIDEKNSTVYIKDKYTSIDVGAIAKGYAADYAAKYLRSEGINVALLNLGGNVIALNDESKKVWKTGVISPDNTAEYTDVLNLSNQSAVTSGNYQRYYEYKGKKYHHIIDGKTLFPATENKAVTIAADSSLEADMFSTALFILPYEKGLEMAEKNNIKALWITSDSTKYTTPDFSSVPK